MPPEQPRAADGTFTSHTSIEAKLEACEKAGIPLRLASRLDPKAKDSAGLLADAESLRIALAAETPEPEAETQVPRGGWIGAALQRQGTVRHGAPAAEQEEPAPVSGGGFDGGPHGGMPATPPTFGDVIRQSLGAHRSL